MIDKVISQKLGQKILQKFFHFQYNFQRLHEHFKSENLSKQYIISFVKEKVKLILLQMECNLFRSGRIKQLKLFDHSSNQMFDQLIKMEKFLPKFMADDLLFEYQCKYQKVESLSTHKKMELYSAFLAHAQKNNLFQYVFVENEEKVALKGPFQNPQRLYHPHQLEIICYYYQLCQADYEEIQKKFRERGMNDDRFKGQKLEANLQNLELIGLYRCYKRNRKGSRMGGVNWDRFTINEDEKLQMIGNWDPNLRSVLIKLAVRNEAQMQEYRRICLLMGLKVKDKLYIQPRLIPLPQQNQQYCDKSLINTLRLRLLQELKLKLQFDKRPPSPDN